MAENNILSIKKALDILDILIFEDIKSKGVSLADLSVKLGQKNTTISNILRTMVSCGYVQKLETGIYSAGDKCRKIGKLNKILPNGDFFDKIEKIIIELSQKIDEPLVFTILSNGIRVPLLRAQVKGVINISVDAVDAVENKNIYSTPTGRVLAAYADCPLKSSPDNVWDGIFEKCNLEANLEKIRNDGFCKVIMKKSQIVALAVPVKITPQGAIGCYAPAFRCDENRTDEILDLLKQAANKIESLQ